MMSRHAVILLLGLLILPGIGCRNDEPQDQFNRDLGEGSVRLPPIDTTIPQSLDGSILQGQTSAAPVRRDEVGNLPEPSPSPEPAAAGTPQIPEAGSVGEALGNVGKALLGNLGGGGAVPTAPSAAPGATPEAAAPTGEQASAEVAEAIRGMIDKYNAARKDGTYSDIPPMLVEAQSHLASEYYDRVEDVRVTLDAFVTTLDKIQPGAKQQTDAAIANVVQPIVVTQVVTAGNDSAVAECSVKPPGGTAQQIQVKFARENGDWRMYGPFLPADADWPQLQTTMQDVISDLEDLTDTANSGTAPDRTEIDSVTQKALAFLAT